SSFFSIFPSCAGRFVMAEALIPFRKGAHCNTSCDWSFLSLSLSDKRYEITSTGIGSSFFETDYHLLFVTIAQLKMVFNIFVDKFSHSPLLRRIHTSRGPFIPGNKKVAASPKDQPHYRALCPASFAMPALLFLSCR